MTMTTREWQAAFLAEVQCKAGWYDCRDDFLVNKTKKIGKIITRVKDGGKVDLDNTYCWFKTNYPFIGPAYDDFRFADIETGNTLMTIAIDDKRENSKYVVYGVVNDWEEPLFECSNVRELAKWLNTA